ncbi:hypothetical protein FKG94_16135 [Exilibacterium tricleocarpae]|uniref:Uncharacterized protein n=1 Tax=Exilibacterium tricleocarpae TaxID=2591008 RepID=A0A545TBE8_9GAMM|nr:hypothetical protein [Exilibacterium tricleocarpae]TQV74539.1 hypothetical protein FKG94_16135 [Exilibacterium tricleocarpae]
MAMFGAVLWVDGAIMAQFFKLRQCGGAVYGQIGRVMDYQKLSRIAKEGAKANLALVYGGF